jgi:hypothetical protein
MKEENFFFLFVYIRVIRGQNFLGVAAGRCRQKKAPLDGGAFWFVCRVLLGDFVF